MGFIHLHVHSQYSFLDGASSLDSLLERAKTLGMPALALTDHNRLTGAVRFYEKALAHGLDKSEVGIHEVSDPQKSGKGKTWLEMYLRNQNHQTEMRVYGAGFIMFKVWRPFMGKKKHAQSVVLKTVRDADQFFMDSLINNLWTGKLSN